MKIQQYSLIIMLALSSYYTYSMEIESPSRKHPRSSERDEGTKKPRQEPSTEIQEPIEQQTALQIRIIPDTIDISQVKTPNNVILINESAAKFSKTLSTMFATQSDFDTYRKDVAKMSPEEIAQLRAQEDNAAIFIPEQYTKEDILFVRVFLYFLKNHNGSITSSEFEKLYRQNYERFYQIRFSRAFELCNFFDIPILFDMLLQYAPQPPNTPNKEALDYHNEELSYFFSIAQQTDDKRLWELLGRMLYPCTTNCPQIITDILAFLDQQKELERIVLGAYMQNHMLLYLHSLQEIPGNALIFNPNGSQYAIINNFPNSVITLYDSKTHRPIHDPIPGDLIVFNPDGSQYAITNGDPSQITLYDSKTHRPIHDPIPGNFIVFNPDGSQYSIQGDYQEVTLYNSLTHLPIYAPIRGDQTIFNPNGSQYAINEGRNSEITLYNSQTHQQINSPIHFVDFVNSEPIIFSPDGSLYAVTITIPGEEYDDDPGYETLLFDSTTHKQVIKTPFINEANITFSPDSSRYTLISGEGTTLYDRQTHQQIGASIEGDTVIFNSNSLFYIIINKKTGVVKFVNALTNQLILTIIISIAKRYTDLYYPITFSPDGCLLSFPIEIKKVDSDGKKTTEDIVYLYGFNSLREALQQPIPSLPNDGSSASPAAPARTDTTPTTPTATREPARTARGPADAAQ